MDTDHLKHAKSWTVWRKRSTSKMARASPDTFNRNISSSCVILPRLSVAGPLLPQCSRVQYQVQCLYKDTTAQVSRRLVRNVHSARVCLASSSLFRYY